MSQSAFQPHVSQNFMHALASRLLLNYATAGPGIILMVHVFYMVLTLSILMKLLTVIVGQIN